MKKIFLIWLFTTLLAVCFGQAMNEMVVLKQAERRAEQIISQEHIDKSGRLCAGLEIITDLTGLGFDSNVGIVSFDYKPGRYIVYVSPRERVLRVHKSGYRQLEVVLSNYGIYGIESGEVYRLEIAAKERKADSLPVIFNVTPADAKIKVGSLSFVSGQPQSLPIGENEVTIEKEGYRPMKEKIEVNENNILFTYNLKEIELVLVKIRSNPQNAKIIIDNVERDVTNRDLFLYPGRYELSLTLSGYLPINEEIVVKETGDNTFNWNLIKNVGVLNFSVTPEDAEVFINYEKQTRLQGIELAPGPYTIEVKAPSHLSKSEQIELKLGQTINKSYNLIKNVSVLNLSVTPNDAEVFINNEKYTRLQGIELAPGPYRIEVRATSHRSESERIELKLGQTLNKSYNLKAITGNLLLEVFPTDAEVEIISGGKSIKKVKGSSRVSDLLVGEYVLKAKANGYKSGEYKTTIKENENNLHKISLNKEAVAQQRTEQREETTQQKKTNISQNMVFVQGGTFKMGRTKGSGYGDELPVHNVTLDSFYISKYLVTQKEYAAVMGSNPANNYGVGDNYPVYYVNWYSAIKFCNLLSMKEGLTPVYSISGSTNPANWGAVPTNRNSTWDAAVCNWKANGYRLPTEAEWEYAARGGTNAPDYLYSGNDDIKKVAWYSGNNSPRGTKPVGGKSPNGLGIYDMSGNLYEWCWDWYDSSYYKSSPSSNPKGPSSGSSRLLRGGYWYYNADFCRVVYRYYYYPSYSNNYVGFRLCRTFP